MNCFATIQPKKCLRLAIRIKVKNKKPKLLGWLRTINLMVEWCKDFPAHKLMRWSSFSGHKTLTTPFKFFPAITNRLPAPSSVNYKVWYKRKKAICTRRRPQKSILKPEWFNRLHIIALFLCSYCFYSLLHNAQKLLLSYNLFLDINRYPASNCNAGKVLN